MGPDIAVIVRILILVLDIVSITRTRRKRDPVAFIVIFE
jgi:hypothetical protein